MNNNNDIIIFSGRSNPQLTHEICNALMLPSGKITINNFSDGEIFVQINENVRGKDVFFVQSTCPPVNDHLMELLIMIDAAKRSSADRITAVIPYFGYGRQDRKDRPRVPITAKLVANMIVNAGASRVLSIDMHTGQLQGFFDIPVDHLIAAPVLINEVRKLPFRHSVAVVAPDAGSAERASIFATHLDAEVAIIDKRRSRSHNNQSKSLHVIGDVLGKDVVIIDDMVDTAGTMLGGIAVLKEEGAENVFVVSTHGVFSGSTVFGRLANSPIEKLLVTNTIDHLSNKNLAIPEKIHYVSVGNLLGNAINFIHNGHSVTSLLNIE